MFKILTGLVVCSLLFVVLLLAGCDGGGSSLAVVSIAVTPTNPSIAAGTTEQFTATGTLSNGTTQDLTAAVTWSSSDSTKATVSNSPGVKGKASAIAAGATTITAALSGKSGTSLLTVTSATLQSLAVTPTNPTIAAGTGTQFTATGTFSDSTVQDLTADVTWSSSDASRATISNVAGSNGLASSLAAGTTTITATLSGKSGTSLLTVTAATLQSIAVTPSNPGIAVGTTQQFTAIGTFTDSSTQDLTASATWSSSATSKATINAAGLASAVAAGSTTITAASGSKSGSTTLTVTPATLVSIAVTPASAALSVNPAGTTQQFTATGSFSDSTTQNLTSTVTWSSSALPVATISNVAGSNGLASTVTAGSATITATSGLISGTATLTVTNATLVSIAVTPAPSAQTTVGGAVQFTATGTYSDSTTQILTTLVTWNSSIPSFGTISNAAGSKGRATGVAIGKTVITATSGSTVSPTVDLEVE